MEEEGQFSAPLADPQFSRHYRATTAGNICNARTGRNLKASSTGTGTRKVSLSADGKTRTAYVAPEVYRAFFGPIPDGYTLRHLDNNKGNCSLSNLHAESPDERRERLRREAERLLWQPVWCRNGQLHASLTDYGLSHGRIKPSRVCSRGHALSMTGEDDANTLVWGVGNRICKACTGLEVLPPMIQQGYRRFVIVG